MCPHASAPWRVRTSARGGGGRGGEDSVAVGRHARGGTDEEEDEHRLHEVKVDQRVEPSLVPQTRVSPGPFTVNLPEKKKGGATFISTVSSSASDVCAMKGSCRHQCISHQLCAVGKEAWHELSDSGWGGVSTGSETKLPQSAQIPSSSGVCPAPAETQRASLRSCASSAMNSNVDVESSGSVAYFVTSITHAAANI